MALVLCRPMTGDLEDCRLNVMSDVTRLIEAANNGDRQAASELLPLLYDELRRLAAAKMAAELPEHTLSPTALVHEAWSEQP